MDIQTIKQRFGIIGNSPKLNHAIRIAMQVAKTEMSVLITGESGVGKESFSKIIHSLSLRKHGTFIAINCGAIPEGTIDSELFGHEKGAYTGALDTRKGYFEVTHKGSIFLDEIGEMPLNTQARLLRVLENGEFIKVGSSKVEKTDVRVIAATNLNLYEAVQKGKFREDLYYRLNTVPIYVPALRERQDDILLLFKKFTFDFAEKYHTQPVKLDIDAEHLLKSQRFLGNIRQLKNLTEQMSLLAIDREISLEQLEGFLPQNHARLPAIIDSTNNNDKEFNEPDIIYKVLFGLKSDMLEVKKLIYKILKENKNEKEIIADHKHLFQDIEPNFGVLKAPKYDRKAPDEETPTLIISDNKEYKDGIEYITPELDMENSLSLEKIEKEMIIKALKKNRNKRKNTAKDLGISERTLYRKIKIHAIESI